MGWFNYYGLAVMAAIMIPNVVYAVTIAPPILSSGSSVGSRTAN